jgi:hypothetical protein
MSNESDSNQSDLPAILSALLRFLSWLLLVSLFGQFFIAGMSSMTNPDWWAYHKGWVGVFQWLVLPLPVLAWFSGRPRLARTAFASMPIAQMTLQYVFVDRALEGRMPFGVGFHALNAALMILIAAALSIGWLDNQTS